MFYDRVLHASGSHGWVIPFSVRMMVWITSGKGHLNGLKRDVAVYVAVLRNTSKGRNILSWSIA